MKVSATETIKSYLENAPETPGVYRMLDKNGKIIYIGKAKNLKNRLKQYTRDVFGKTLKMVALVCEIQYSVTESESAALLLEAQLIKKFKPQFNILLKDDKSFPFIKLRLNHEFPQLIKYRGRDFSDGEFFGPFISAREVEITLLELQKIFKLRSCSDTYFANRTRPCLQYQINRCTAPCTGKISKNDYDDLVEQVKLFLKGKNQSLQQMLAAKMDSLSENLQFEEAANIRDRIKALSYIQLRSENSGIIEDTDLIAVYEHKGQFCLQLYIYRSGQACGNQAYFPEHTEEQTAENIIEAFISQLYQNNKIPAPNILISHELQEPKILTQALKELHNIDVKIKFVRGGKEAKIVQIATENAKLALEEKVKKSAQNTSALLEVAKIFNLPAPPNRIEVYDNSHIQGSFPVGAMVVAGANGFEKKEYRLFTIKNQDVNLAGGDDYGMLREVMTRRLSKLTAEPEKKPDLMIIDGGKGHMRIVQEVQEKLGTNIPFACMAKGVDRNSGREYFHQPNREAFTLDKNLPVMKYLQILRDEVHNFVIKNHRKKRSKAIRSSSLDTIPGIGQTRKKALLSYFGSFAAIADATIGDLTKVKGISKEMAAVIYQHLRN